MKSRSKVISFVFVFVFAIGVAGYSPPVHTFHTSLMQLEFDRKEQLVEISLQVFTHDLENVLSHRSGRKVSLDKSPDAARLTLKYLNETISLRNRDGQLKPLSWVGMESQADAVWLYVETKMTEGLEGAELRDRIFFELLDDQVNLVHIKQDEKKSDLVFKPGDNFKAILPATPSVK